VPDAADRLPLPSQAFQQLRCRVLPAPRDSGTHVATFARASADRPAGDGFLKNTNEVYVSAAAGAPEIAVEAPVTAAGVARAA
jgi:hypothetical protein